MARTQAPLAPLPAAFLAIIALTVWLPGGFAAQLQAAIAGDSVTLLKDGTSSHRIVLHADASPSEKTAADELVTHI